MQAVHCVEDCGPSPAIGRQSCIEMWFQRFSLMTTYFRAQNYNAIYDLLPAVGEQRYNEIQF